MKCDFEVGDILFDSDGNKWEVIDVNDPENDVENHDVQYIELVNCRNALQVK